MCEYTSHMCLCMCFFCCFKTELKITTTVITTTNYHQFNELLFETKAECLPALLHEKRATIFFDVCINFNPLWEQILLGLPSRTYTKIIDTFL